MQTNRRRAALLATLALVLTLVWLRPIDALAEQSVATGLKRALVTFGSARALNALISLAQSASVSVQIGAGVSVQPGAVLDPLDDAVEQFSMVMLVATVSFAAQHLLIAVFGAWPVSLVLTSLLLVYSALLLSNRSVPAWLSRATLALFFLSISVPLASLASEVTYRMLLAKDYEAAQAQIRNSELLEPEATSTEGNWEKLKRLWSGSTDIGRQIANLRSQASNLVEHLVRLVAVFVVQTVFLPLFFLWALFRLYRVFLPTKDDTNKASNVARWQP